MEQWDDQAIILSARAHGEHGAVVTVLTAENGRHAGYVQGGQSRRKRGMLEPGNLVDISWQARTADSLGTFRIDQERHSAMALLDDPLKFSALLAASALCRDALPEREPHPGVFSGFLALSDALQDNDIWGAVYVMWELALLRELGFAIQLDQCAGGGNDDNLAYVSPKSGQAVSEEAGEPYKDVLLPLPDFLKPEKGDITDQGILQGIELTGYFFQHRVFAQHSRGIPEERLRFAQRFAKYVEQNEAVL